MPKIEIRNLENQVVGTMDLSEEIFEAPVNEGLLHDAVRQYRASHRSGTHATKTRGEVQGSGRKPWRQKGTGRARVGEIRTPCGARAVPCSGRIRGTTSTISPGRCTGQL
jgi:large subunit ribosomal protein L4